MRKRSERPSLQQPADLRAIVGRREFLVRSSGLLVVGALTTACEEGDATVEVSVFGLQSGFTTAGSATITGEKLSEPLVVTMIGVSSARAKVPSGTYHVIYAPPTGYGMDPTSDNEIDVRLRSGATERVDFAVVQAAGTLRLNVTGLSGSAADGGSAQVLRTDISGQSPVTVNIPASGTVDASVQPGTYSITYTAPGGHQLESGQVNPRTGVVVAGTTPVSVTFQVQVQAADATLRLNVSGLTGGPPNGGSAQVLRTDISGQSPVTVNIPASGTVDTPVQSGTYTITYTAPSGHQLAPGQVNPRTGVVVAGTTPVSVTFQVVVSQTPTGIVFSSDFRTALGTGTAAITDGGKWNLVGGEGQEIVATAGLGINFPTQNVLKVNATTTRSGFALLRKTGMPVPTPPFNRYYRWYYRHVKPSISGGNNQHPIQDGNAQGDCNWTMDVNQIDNATWRTQHVIGPERYALQGTLLMNHTYRIELHIQAINAQTLRGHVRYYDESGTLVFDSDDFRAGSANYLMSEGRPQAWTNIANLDGLNCGLNGVNNLTQNVVHSYQGAFAVSDSDWIGPYANGV
jgi:hypothetical protein